MSESKKSFWNSVSKKASDLGKSISHQASETGKNITQKATDAAKQKATEMGETMNQKASEAGEKVKEKASSSVESAKQKTQNWVENIYSGSDESSDSTHLHDWSLDELYHIFVRSKVAYSGGTQTVTLKTGKSYEVKIPPNLKEGSNLRLKGCGLQGGDAFLVLHTLLNPLFNVDRKINNLIVQAPVYDRTKFRCLESYNRLISGMKAEDLAALDLLDYLVLSSNIYSEMGQRYAIASQNSRLLALEDGLKKTLEVSQLSDEEQKKIRSTYQYLRSGEAVPDLRILDQLDAIILYSNLKPELKKYYLKASAATRVMTIDWIMVNEIDVNQQIVQADRPRFLAVYLQLRNEQEVVDLRTLEALDAWVEKANLPLFCKVSYQLLRQQSLELSEEFEWDDFSDSFKAIEAVLKAVKTSKSYHSSNDSYSVNVTEIKPEMLTETAYNSVARGGLGLLSGLAILQQQKTWLEISARLAIATVSEMKSSDKLKLGLSAMIDKGTPQTVVGGNWQAVSALGKQEQRISQLSGLDAYRAILIEIEDVADLAQANDGSTVNSGLNVWKLLRGNSDRQRVIEQLEHQLYC